MLYIAVVSHLPVTILVSKCMFLSSAGGDVIYSGRFTSTSNHIVSKCMFLSSAGGDVTYSGRFTSTSNHISIEMHVSIFSWW